MVGKEHIRTFTCDMKYAAVTKLIIQLIAVCITAINEFIVFVMGRSKEQSVLFHTAWSRSEQCYMKTHTPQDHNLEQIIGN